MSAQSTSPNNDSQVTANDVLTSVDETGLASGNQELVSGLFFEGEFDASEFPADLVNIIMAWPQLPEHIKAAIKALIETNNKGKK